MNHEFMRNRTVQLVIKWIVALSFALFTFYQIILAIVIDASRVGRLIGIAFYTLITVASFLGLSQKPQSGKSKIERIEIAQMILLVTGLTLLFIMRLLSVVTVFGNLNFAYPATVLYTASYILSQLGTLVIISGHFVLLTKLREQTMMKVENTLMSVAIVLYALCFIAEGVMMIKYRYMVDLNLTFTLISRVWYFLGFAGTAFCFMLPAPRERRKHQSSEFYYSEDAEDEIDLIL